MNNIITNTLSTYEQISIQQTNRNFWLNLIVAVITLVSAILVYIDYRNRKNKERAEKSINIAEEFAKSIIPRISILFGYFEKIHLDEIINKVKFINFSDFDNEELHELYTDSDIESYQHLLEENKSFLFNDKQIFLEDFIIILLNELEHMCMYISTKVADDKYIYSSLHQQFFKAISSLYISISLINLDNKDKYYTNIIDVFNLWKNKYIKSEKKEEKYQKQQDKLKYKEKKLKAKSKPKIHKVK